MSARRTKVGRAASLDIEFGFAYRGMELEGEFTIDIRGRMGHQDVRPHFQTVRVQALVDTDEPEGRLAAVVDEPERRCPVFNLLHDAGVRLEMHSIRAPQPGLGLESPPRESTWTPRRPWRQRRPR